MRKGFRVILWAVGIIILLILILPFMIPVPPLQDTVPPQQLADPDSRFTTVDGLNVHYKVMGEDEPALILLHGFGASTFSWREVMPELAKRNRVIAFDRPAHGLTERPLNWEGENPYSAEFQTDLVVGIMDQLGLEHAVLVGNSAGGAIAMLTALYHPDRIDGLVLVDPAVYQGGRPKWMSMLFNTPQMQHLGPLFARRIQGWGREFTESAWNDPTKITEEIWAGYTLPLKADHWDEGLWNLTAASRDLDLDQELDRFQLPVLVISGENDRIVPAEESIRLAQELTFAKSLVILECGHVPQEECPEPFLEAVQEFLLGL